MLCPDVEYIIEHMAQFVLWTIVSDRVLLA